MSTPATTSTNVKPSLSGVRIKARKGAVKASAKHEPSVFRDQLYKYLETVSEGDFEGYTNKLITAGANLEFIKYSDALFEVLLVGGLLQPGGNYLDDGAPPSPFSVSNVAEPPTVDEVKKYIDVLGKVMRRYKYLQKPLETSSLPALLQNCAKWPVAKRDKLAIATGLLISQQLANASCLVNLQKDQLTKDDTALNIVTVVFRTILSQDPSMEAFSGHLKKGGIKDILLFFPPTKHDVKHLESHFKAAGLPQVVDFYIKRQYAIIKETITKHLKEMVEATESADSMIEYIKESQTENLLPETELVHCIWAALVASVDWSIARPDQVDAMVMKETKRISAVLAPFCSGGKTQIALLNVVQVYCYENTRIMKSFPSILKVLYNEDCVSDQAIIYWYQKGSKPQGRQHFLQASEPLVKYLQQQEDESEEEE
ncbi:hypothetical protein M407DRAFT_147612 [Tulasnella calospora MUT 4182]|uniref:W2 domain-containing protein n=1 Tax=Tulasnella calospora MUT 4182 TaxID=1051891 RepID=A0A0C3MAK1_9AGAM|nr:hypothetical protein M407DRAFT_147612 [Tulasnella calospora MUT 4182]